MTDILTGIRLALGVAWIVLVPGRISGRHQRALATPSTMRATRSTTARLAATVVVTIGIIGFMRSISSASRPVQHRELGSQHLNVKGEERDHVRTSNSH